MNETIQKLRRALNEILECRLNWDRDYPEVLADMRQIARTALKETEMTKEQYLVARIDECKEIVD